jgi:hypothetical protein
MVNRTAIEQLESMDDPEVEQGQDQPSDTDFENPANPSEAERSAPVRIRDMTHAMRTFVAAKLSGKSSKDSYRQAYPNDTSTDQTISSNAYKLTKHPLVAKALQDAWGQTEEALVDDLAASKRYVIQSLIAMSKSAKQEGSRLKALELLGKASGAFAAAAPATEAPLTAAELKAQLSGHLKLLKG